MTQIENIVEAIKEIQTDTTLPKNVKAKLDEATAMLLKEGDESIRIDKAIHLLDDLAEDANIPSYIRTQLWNILSMLESG